MSDELAGMRRLAAAILIRAARDASADGEAAAWIAASDEFLFWCGLADKECGS